MIASRILLWMQKLEDDFYKESCWSLKQAKLSKSCFLLFLSFNLISDSQSN